MHFGFLWIKASSKCININANILRWVVNHENCRSNSNEDSTPPRFQEKHSGLTSIYDNSKMCLAWNTIYTIGSFNPKWKFCYHLLTLLSFQTWKTSSAEQIFWRMFLSKSKRFKATLHGQKTLRKQCSTNMRVNKCIFFTICNHKMHHWTKIHLALKSEVTWETHFYIEPI